MKIALFTLLLVSTCLAQSASETFCTEILRLYPTDFVDQIAWWKTCERIHDLDQLMDELHDPLLKLVTDVPVMSDVSYSQMKISTTGYIRLSGFYGGAGFVALFDSALEKARFDDGLILDLFVLGCGYFLY